MSPIHLFWRPPRCQISPPQRSINLILKALEDEVTLSVLEFFDFLFLFQFVILHCSADIIGIGRVLRVEHVCTEIQHRFLVTTLLVRLANLPLTKLLHELRDPVNEIALIDTLREALLGEIGQADQEVDQY